MDNIKLEELEKACKNYKVRIRMVAVRMVLVLDTVDTMATRRAVEGCKPPRICCICVAF